MAVLDDIAAIKPSHRTFADWLASDPAEAPGVLDAVRDNQIAISPLLRALRANGIPCTDETIRAYRNGNR